ncbi:hypothetical protein GUJ93_ZPchr0014g47156 [Zizania palustris]|uniref:Uncharacterized protein n=1 Tax=Zizania palustris TaxID=103762 RepID=A0A8J5T7I4_ZIZPA|nr:hypothetical protein GUJ93_ZPchr0014g47156 [Zizania palustris]
MGFLVTGRIYCESATTAEPTSRPTPPLACHNGMVALSGEGLRSRRGISELWMAGGSAPGEVAQGGGRLRTVRALL